jgi:DNA mismatch endonuclease (patch repair protein)
MADVHSPETRSRNMSAIKGKDTKPEMLIRRGLHAHGFRYRLHDNRLPGKPDLVLPKYNAVILIHGCFWHCHKCGIFRWPKTRTELWRKKIEANAERDQRQLNELHHDWEMRSLVVWECALKGKQKRPMDEVVDLVDCWLGLEQSDPSYWYGSIQGYEQ